VTVLDRFLRYVRYDTQSDESSKTYPSTARQLVLLRDLAQELRDLGLTDAAVDDFGYVMATIPATTTADVPTIGFIAHVDTSPEMPGANVKPLVHRSYDGRDLALPDDPSAVLRLADNPALRDQFGNDIVTASGATLLGADDKAGVAEIVTAAAPEKMSNTRSPSPLTVVPPDPAPAPATVTLLVMSRSPVAAMSSPAPVSVRS